MNLHRYNKAPDWELTPPGEQNAWQRIAARTNGIVTPGNVVSAAGAALTLKGLRDIGQGRTKSGIGNAVAGRLLDLGDGMVAHATGTKGPIGEAIDVAVDKVEMAVALPALAEGEVVPRSVALSFGLQNGANVLLIALAKLKNREVHSSKAGKHATFAQWVTMGAFATSALARESDKDKLASDLEAAGYALAAVATVLGIQATSEYFKEIT
ncbi:MAG TPA: CDP-alcohol phosphatidyltransferase family protein [Candidatus Binatia bacterium]|nr:CDP-alcohol phosphatidyltransferase family protein [Candidatus Binatia bacterium]